MCFAVFIFLCVVYLRYHSVLYAFFMGQTEPKILRFVYKPLNFY